MWLKGALISCTTAKGPPGAAVAANQSLRIRQNREGKLSIQMRKRARGSKYVRRQASAIHAACQRLIGEGEMGALFKVMGLTAPNWPDGAGF